MVKDVGTAQGHPAGTTSQSHERRTPEQLGAALGCVIYDALMLAVALDIHQRRFAAPFFEGLHWGEPQIAIEVMLLKSRCLIDFLSPRSRKHGDIKITDFGADVIELPPEIRKFRQQVNKWSAHLSWRRTLLVSDQPMQSAIESGAKWVLQAVLSFIEGAVGRGVSLTETRHIAFLTALRRQDASRTGG